MICSCEGLLVSCYRSVGPSSRDRDEHELVVTNECIKQALVDTPSAQGRGDDQTDTSWKEQEASLQ